MRAQTLAQPPACDSAACASQACSRTPRCSRVPARVCRGTAATKAQTMTLSALRAPHGANAVGAGALDGAGILVDAGVDLGLHRAQGAVLVCRTGRAAGGDDGYVAACAAVAVVVQAAVVQKRLRSCDWPGCCTRKG